MGSAGGSLEDRARGLHQERERDERDEVSQYDECEDRLAQAATRPGIRDHRRRHRRGEADEDHDQQREHRHFAYRRWRRARAAARATPATAAP